MWRRYGTEATRDLLAEMLRHPVVQMWMFWHGMIYDLLMAGQMLFHGKVFLFPLVSVLGHDLAQDLLPFLGWGTGRWICCGLLEWVRGGGGGEKL